MPMMSALFVLSLVISLSAAARGEREPPVPAWPLQFTSRFSVYVEQYGPAFNSTGYIYYDWTVKTFRADYIDWCLPLFGSGPTDHNDYTCSFLATEESMFFVNHTATIWSENQCCLFAEGLAAVPPNWMQNTQYNGTNMIRGVPCDRWVFPGTSDPEKPCYYYWDSLAPPHIPMRFFGLSSVGPTILDYTSFAPGKTSADLHLPNKACAVPCKPPTERRRRTYPHFPSCE